MTVKEVRVIVQLQAQDNLNLVNDHRISLKDALVAPEKIKVTVRNVKNGKLLKDWEEDVGSLLKRRAMTDTGL